MGVRFPEPYLVPHQALIFDRAVFGGMAVGSPASVSVQDHLELITSVIIPATVWSDPWPDKAKALPWTHQGPSPWTSCY